MDWIIIGWLMLAVIVFVGAYFIWDLIQFFKFADEDFDFKDVNDIEET